jgi:hypothetical protein
VAEEYNEYGEIKKTERNLSFDQQHRVHQTKDVFDSECSLCQQDMKKRVKTYWSDDE